jgi:hypothetical protein
MHSGLYRIDWLLVTRTIRTLKVLFEEILRLNARLATWRVMGIDDFRLF